VFELVTETSNAHSTGVGLYNTVGTVTVTISGIGTVTLVGRDNFGVGLATSTGFVGFGDYTINELIVGLGDAALTSYDLADSIGPLTGTAITNAGTAFPTSAGNLVLTSAGPVTFTADAEVPEPPSVILLSVALLLFPIASRCRTLCKPLA